MLFVSLNSLPDMDTEAIVIRIKTPSGDMDSSVDCPSLLNFNDLLVSPPECYAASMVVLALLISLDK